MIFLFSAKNIAKNNPKHFPKPITHLVGGFNPFAKYARQIGHLPQIGLENEQIFETTT